MTEKTEEVISLNIQLYSKIRNFMRSSILQVN